MASVIILFHVSLCLAICGQFDFVESSPLLGDRKVVYTRYVRRRPIPYSTDYVKDVVEVFNTQRRPPPYAFLHDEDLTRFVRCDFDPSMPDCDDETHSVTTIPASRTSTTAQTDVFPTTSSTSSTKSASSLWWGRTTETTTTTTTEQNILLAPAMPQETTSTVKSPSVSEEYDGDNNSEGENDNEYDDENNKEAKKIETDNGPNETEYYDEGENNENNNSEDAIESNDDDAEDEGEAEDETEPQTEETTTKKSTFGWF